MIPKLWPQKFVPDPDGKRAGLAVRISIATTLIGLVIGLIGTVIYYGIIASTSSIERRIFVADREVARQLLRSRSDLDDYLATGRKEFLLSHQAALIKLKEALTAMKYTSISGSEQALVTRDALMLLSAEIQEWETKYAMKAIKLRQTDYAVDASILQGMRDRGISAGYTRKIERSLDDLQRGSDSWLSYLRQKASARRDTALRLLLVGFFMLVGGGAYFVSWYVVRLEYLLQRSRLLENLAVYADRMHHIVSVDQAASALTASIGGGENLSTVLISIPDESGMRIVASTGDPSSDAAKSPVLGDKEACPVMRTGQRFMFRDQKQELPCECPACATRDGGYVCVPLLAQGRIVGLANWQAGRGRKPATPDLDRIEEYARVTSLALSNLFSLEGAKHDALTDKLTGVSNRRFLDGYLGKQFQISLRQKHPLGILMLDLDKFKAFNDHNGHPAGDTLLGAVARTALNAVREGDLVARYGGEEFAVVLPDADMTKTLEIAERIRLDIENLLVDTLPSLQPPLITVSIGAAVAPADGRTYQEVLQAADKALYRAKAGGRNRVIATSEDQAGRS
jgi:diguanylate cyclase (GGDEF)-like protein